MFITLTPDSCRIKRLEQKGDLEMEKGKEFSDLDLVQVRKVPARANAKTTTFTVVIVLQS